jgi:peptidoglycan-associated lipoprotein
MAAAAAAAEPKTHEELYMRRSLVALVSLVAVVGLVGCKPKPPKTSGVEIASSTVQPQPTDVAPPTQPSTADDGTANPLSGDLEKVNSYVRSQGLLGDVYFDFDRYELKDAARERLRKNADFLKSNPEFLITLEGHCDERGTNDYNLALGDRRANATKEYLISLGVPASRFQRVVSYGEERQVCNNTNEACWAQNRRAAFVVTGRAN